MELTKKTIGQYLKEQAAVIGESYRYGNVWLELQLCPAG